MDNQSQNFDDAFIEAVGAFDREDYEKAYKLFLPLAEQGHDDAQYLLASMHLGYAEGPQDYKEVQKWYRLSAEQGNTDAQYILGAGGRRFKSSRPDHLKQWVKV